MSDQPKLKLETAEPWEHVAREFGDHDMETEGAPYCTHEVMRPVDDAYYIGDWLPVEPVCKEVVALRAKLDAIHRYVADRADIDAIGSPNGELCILHKTVNDRIQSLLSDLKQLQVDMGVAARSGARSLPSPDYLPERPRVRVMAFLEAAQHGLSQAGYGAMHAQVEADYEQAKMRREQAASGATRNRRRVRSDRADV